MYESAPHLDHEPIWAEFSKPVDEARVALLSSAGVFLPATQAPFDLEREKREPTWGDPTLRLIPSDVTQDQIGAAHLHINTADILADVNVALPVHRLNELAAAGRVGSAAANHFSLMGFQEEGTDVWRTATGPEIAQHCHDDAVDAVILAPA